MFGALPVHNPTMRLPRIEVSENGTVGAAVIDVIPMRTERLAHKDASVVLGRLLARFSASPMRAFEHAPIGAAITATVLDEIGVHPTHLSRAWYRDTSRAVWVKVGEPTEAVLYGGSRHGQVIELVWSHPWEEQATFRQAGNSVDIWRVTPIRDEGNRVVFHHEELPPPSRLDRLRQWPRRLRDRSRTRHDGT
jgi:hypothetical protein